MMHHAITKDDMKNGDGLRIVLWVSGCEHKCPECHNPQTWNADRGEPFTEWEEAELFKLLSQEHISGITFSGGDPLHPANRDTVGRLTKKVAEMGKDVWLYTGYIFEYEEDTGEFIFTDRQAGLDNVEVDWLRYVDVLVDGRFIAEIRREDIRKNADPQWRGSSNQRLIDVKKSLSLGHIVHLDGMVESYSAVYNHCIKHYKNFDLLVESPKQMLALCNILEAHESSLEALHTYKGDGSFCHMWPESSEDTDLTAALLSNNAFFFTKEEFYEHYKGLIDEEVEFVSVNSEKITHTVYYASDRVVVYGNEVLPDNVVKLMQEGKQVSISSGVCEYRSYSQSTFMQYLQNGDIVKTTDGYVHLNIT